MPSRSRPRNSHGTHGEPQPALTISNVIEYAARLRLLGKDVSLLVDADATHSNSDPVAREAYLYLLESMLARHLGGKPAAVPDSELRKYLDRNLRIRGTGLSGP